tara:strand:- start:82 stop:300 length:219 start_codon:yes stop_codon:yes gene_type:complete
MTNSAFDDWFNYLLHVVFVLSDAIKTLLLIPKKGIWKDPKIVLQQLTVKELKTMLAGHRTTNLRKSSLLPYS